MTTRRLKKSNRKIKKKSQLRGAISIDFVVILLIVTTSVFFLLALFSKNLSGFSRAIYCKTVFYVQSRNFIPLQYRQDPEYCKYSLFMKTRIIEPQLEYISEFPGYKNREIINNFTKNNISLTFNIPPKDIEGLEFRIKQDKIEDIYLNFCNETRRIKINKKLYYVNLNKDSFEKCNKTLNQFVLNMSGSSQYARISEFKLSYKKCYPNEEILAHILACWESVNYGNYAKNKICEQFILSKDCNEVDTSEEKITRLMEDNGVCHILGNNDTLNCGEENNLNYTLTKIKHGQNYIIEFDSKNKMIRVS